MSAKNILVAEKVRLFLYPVFGGCFIFLAAERYNLFPLLFLFPFFLNGMRALSLRKKLLAYWLMAMVANLGGFNWISIVGRDFGGLPGWVSFGLLLFFSIFNNLNFLLWAYLERFFGEKSSPFVIATLFCVAEQVNPQVFPWYFGTLLDSAPVLYQTADLFGVIGLSFVGMTLIHIPYWIWQHRKGLFSTHKMVLFRQLGFATFIVLYGLGALNRYDNEPGPGRKAVAVTLVQSNTSMEKFYGAHLGVEERIDEFLSLIVFSKEAIAASPDKPDILVWPEGAIHFPILSNTQIYNSIAELARQERIYIAAGSVEVEGRNDAGGRVYYNTQFIIDPDGGLAGKYRKIVLLAFGEYIPLVDTFPALQKWLPETISQFTRGSEKPVFEIGDKATWLPLICYEDIIAGFIDGFEHSRADFMVNTTNDGWFGKSHASHLHKQMARPRAVEYRKPLLRVLNTGTSQVIDSAGRTISKDTEQFIRDYINVTLHLPEEPPVTVYSIIGNWPVYFLIVLVAIAWTRKKFFPSA